MPVVSESVVVTKEADVNKTKEIMKKEGGKKLLLEVRLTRKSKGVELYLRSPVLCELFKTTDKKSTSAYLDVTLPEEQQERKYSTKAWAETRFISEPGIITHWGGSLFEGGHPNVSFLRACELDVGAYFLIQQPFTTEQLTRWMDLLRSSVNSLYQNHVKKFNNGFLIYMEEA